MTRKELPTAKEVLESNWAKRSHTSRSGAIAAIDEHTKIHCEALREENERLKGAVEIAYRDGIRTGHGASNIRPYLVVSQVRAHQIIKQALIKEDK